MKYLKTLPKNQVNALEKAFRESKNTREKLRYHGLWLCSRGYSQEEASSIIGRGTRSIRRWVTIYNKEGISGLREKPVRGNNYKISRAQKDQIKQIINSKIPEELGYEGRFWSMQTLKQLVKDEFKVEYNNSVSYQNLFHYCGFSYHKPNKVNKKQQEHMRERFKDELKKSSGGTREKIVWSW